MTKTVNWLERVKELDDNYSDEAALKLYNDKFNESSQEDTSLDKPSLIKRIAKTAFYALGAGAVMAAGCAIMPNATPLVEVGSVVGMMLGSSTLGWQAMRTAEDTLGYADRMKLWNKQQTEQMKGMTEEEKNAYKIKYVKDDLASRKADKCLGVNALHQDLHDTLECGRVTGAAFGLGVALPAAGAATMVAIIGGGAAIGAKRGYDAVKDKINGIRNSVSSKDEPGTPKNSI